LQIAVPYAALAAAGAFGDYGGLAFSCGCSTSSAQLFSFSFGRLKHRDILLSWYF
jgi:hypothetical protein